MKDQTNLEVLKYDVLGRLPPLMRMEDGREIGTEAEWQERRKELYRSAVELQYGTLPPPPEFLEIEELFVGNTWSNYRITSGTRACPVSFIMRVGRPFGVPVGERFPVIVDGDVCFGYQTRSAFIDPPMEAGIGWVLFDRTEIAPDVREAGRNAAIYRAYPERTFGAIGAWAWGYSRCVDAVLKLGLADPDCITFTGHSRGGKTAMLAGVTDERAGIVNPVQTCAGSCSCYRISMEALNHLGIVKRSEMLSDLMRNYDFWMGEGMVEYADDPTRLPFDAHYLKALIAPRTLFVAEAVHDVWANPIGSWQTTLAAGEAFRLLGAEDALYWYYRDGGHDHSEQDVRMLVNLICHKKDGTPLNGDFFRRPFEEREKIF